MVAPLHAARRMQARPLRCSGHEGHKAGTGRQSLPNSGRAAPAANGRETHCRRPAAGAEAGGAAEVPLAPAAAAHRRCHALHQAGPSPRKQGCHWRWRAGAQPVRAVVQAGAYMGLGAGPWAYVGPEVGPQVAVSGCQAGGAACTHTTAACARHRHAQDLHRHAEDPLLCALAPIACPPHTHTHVEAGQGEARLASFAKDPARGIASPQHHPLSGGSGSRPCEAGAPLPLLPPPPPPWAHLGPHRRIRNLPQHHHISRSSAAAAPAIMPACSPTAGQGPGRALGSGTQLLLGGRHGLHVKAARRKRGPQRTSQPAYRGSCAPVPTARRAGLCRASRWARAARECVCAYGRGGGEAEEAQAPAVSTVCMPDR